MNSLFQNMARLQVKASNYEPEAKAFFAKGVALGEAPLSATDKDYVNDWFKSVKDAGFYSKLKVVRLFVGGTAVWHSINAVDVDNHQATFGGSPTHDSNGITYNGTNQWMDSNYARSNLAADSFSMGVYSRTSGITGYDQGIEDTGGSNRSIWIGNRVSGDRFQTSYGNWTHDETGITDGSGFFSISAVASGANTVVDKYINGISVDNNTQTTSGIGISTLDIFDGALNSNGAANYYSNRNMCFSFIAEGLSTTEMADLYTAVQALQVALSRNV